MVLDSVTSPHARRNYSKALPRRARTASGRRAEGHNCCNVGDVGRLEQSAEHKADLCRDPLPRRRCQFTAHSGQLGEDKARSSTRKVEVIGRGMASVGTVAAL